MRWTETLIPTLKEDPSEAVAASHRLMLRAGMVRQVGAGSYTYLPLGLRVLRKIADLVRSEMDAAGAVEVLMPILWPAELMEATGRLDAFGEDLIRFDDRHARSHVLAPTHEETATTIVRDELRSYRQLPIIIYQVQTKIRDEVRPRFGIIRTREFMMKDAYSFSADEADLDECYERMRAAYRRILERCGLDYAEAEAESGAMGGGESHEFIVPASVGTAEFVECTACGHAANVERAAAPPMEREQEQEQEQEQELRVVETPGQTTIEQVSEFLGVEPARMIKTLVYVADGRPVAVLVRGDHEANEDKVRRHLGAGSLELADAETIGRVTGAPAGFAGPVGLEGAELLVDHAVRAVRGGVTGANAADRHMIGVVPGRDFPCEETHDLRFVTAEDRCARCGGAIELRRGVEAGHIFKLGTHYSRALGATFRGPSGEDRPFVMGSYGIGINRLAAAVVECGADEKGIVWPPGLAPYDVVVMALDVSQSDVTEAAEAAEEQLRSAGVDVLLDDRDERPGAKFKDADLIGFPLKVVVGRGFLQSGLLELQARADGTRANVAPADLVETVRGKLAELTPQPRG